MKYRRRSSDSLNSFLRKDLNIIYLTAKLGQFLSTYWCSKTECSGIMELCQRIPMFGDNSLQIVIFMTDNRKLFKCKMSSTNKYLF